ALKLFTSVLAGIRSYASIMEVENYRKSLEDKVKERTKELAEKNLSITSSISYAGRIQNALLPLREEIDGLLPSWFILNKPRDIVSGDFYWIARKREKIVVAVGDCTGHGVPGAFMSILGISTLNEVVSKSEYLKPDEILNRVREQVIRSLHQTGRDDETRDGIEIALCVFDFPKKKLQFSGAFRPLYLVRDNSLQEFKGDFMPIGIYDDKERPFSSKELDLKENDTIYLFSDGYVDQIGGPDRKTFRAKKFKQLLTDIHREPINEQKEILEKKHEEWKGNMVQIDDILVLGIRFSER
ncbi:MAG: SpoIIE family protein phosphatase, partial [Bacteroidales bacterium]